METRSLVERDASMSSMVHNNNNNSRHADVNNIYVTRSSIPPMEEYIEEIKSIWDTHFLTNMGEKHEALRARLKEYMQAQELELFTNGHMAIELSLQALDLKGEVITTPFTFASTTHAIVRNGLTPVFCDIKEDDYTMDPDKIEDLITDRTCAIMPVHVYGNICDVDAIDRIAKKHNLKVIYDAAHTFGEVYRGVSVGNFGDVSCFSFHATKVFNTIEGGATVYKDPAFGKKLYQLKNFGIKNEECVDGVGANAKMNEFCAAMGLCNLRHLDEEIAKRKIVWERYQSNLQGCDGIVTNHIKDGLKSNYSYYPILVKKDQYGCDRNELFERLKEHGFIARKYFYPLTNEFDCYQGRFNLEATPIAHNISREVLTLPMYADLEMEIVDEICNLILSNAGR